MSDQEQDTLFTLLRFLVKRHGAGKFITFLVGVPCIIGAIAAIVTYNFAVIEYVQELNYAKVAAPLVVSAVNAERDSLNVKEHYHFSALEIK